MSRPTGCESIVVVIGICQIGIDPMYTPRVDVSAPLELGVHGIHLSIGGAFSHQWFDKELGESVEYDLLGCEWCLAGQTCPERRTSAVWTHRSDKWCEQYWCRHWSDRRCGSRTPCSRFHQGTMHVESDLAW